MKDFETGINQVISSQTQELLCDAIKESYYDAIQRDIAVESTPHMFGTDIYYRLRRKLDELTKLETNPIERVQDTRKFKLKIGNFVITCMRCGKDYSRAVSQAYPYDKRKLVPLTRQPNLPFKEFEESSSVREIVLGHRGNRFDGVVDIFFAKPYMAANKVAWEDFIVIYNKQVTDVINFSTPESEITIQPKELNKKGVNDAKRTS